MGRPAKPTKLKLLRGNPGKRPLPLNEPVAPDGGLACPDRLVGRAREFWAEHAPILLAMGCLTVADIPMLAELCDVEDEYWTAREDVRKNGMRSGSRTSPAVHIASDAGKRLKALMCEFGMSPSSRTRISVPPKVEAEDPFAEFERQA